MDDQARFLLLVVERLDALGIDYMVTGSMALALYAMPRMTRDVDVVIEINSADVESFVREFAADCVIDRDDVIQAIDRSGMFNVIHAEWLVKADFIVRKSETYRKVEFDRRRDAVIEGRSVSVVSPEDLILSKLHWSRDSGSELQRRDVAQLLKHLPSLDETYLRKWAAELGVRVPEIGDDDE